MAGGIAAWELLGRTIYGAGPRGSRLGPIEYVPALTKEDEVLPVTLQMHPELLDDEKVVEEYTWHMQSSASSLIATFRDGQAGADTANATCAYRAAPGCYLLNIATGSPPPSSSLAGAQTWCCAHPVDCGGVTKNGKTGLYQARLNSEGCTSSSGESSWIRKGANTPKSCKAHPPSKVGGGEVAAEAWYLLLSEKATPGDRPAYRYDLIDFGRQALESNFSTLASEFKAAALAGAAKNATSAATKLLEMLDDYDELLGSDKNFMLGTWIAWARSWSNITNEQEFFEYNARNQITLWGPTGQINDYAAKSWSGLVSHYYKPRWKLFTTEVLANIKDLSHFKATSWMEEIGLPFSNDTKPFPTEPVGDTVEIAARLFQKYVAAQ